MILLPFNDFPFQTDDKVRYADTDRQGHVNNANFSIYFETGRVEIFYNPENALLVENASFVIASLKLDYLKEIHWPGRVEIGTGILRVGNSSIRIYQQLFQNDECVARAEATVVQVDGSTRRSTPLSDTAKARLNGWLIEGNE